MRQEGARRRGVVLRPAPPGREGGQHAPAPALSADAVGKSPRARVGHAPLRAAGGGRVAARLEPGHEGIAPTIAGFDLRARLVMQALRLLRVAVLPLRGEVQHREVIDRLGVGRLDREGPPVVARRMVEQVRLAEQCQLLLCAVK